MAPTIIGRWWRVSRDADTALDNSRLIALIEKPRFERGFFWFRPAGTTAACSLLHRGHFAPVQLSELRAYWSGGTITKGRWRASRDADIALAKVLGLDLDAPTSRRVHGRRGRLRYLLADLIHRKCRAVRIAGLEAHRGGRDDERGIRQGRGVGVGDLHVH
jgi:hypothetical protein